MSKAFKYLLATLVLLTPAAALALDLNPIGGNAWDLFTMGSGRAVSSTLTAVSMLMSSPGYRSLLSLTAVIGAIIMASLAGFSPLQMGPKFIGYVITAWLVTFASASVTSNVMVNDPVTNYHHVTQKVPSVVALPFAMISTAGDWMTKAIEGTFTVGSDPTTPKYPASMQLSQGGQFNLANQLFADLGKLHISDPLLKGSVANYVTDCVVPEMAMGHIRADVLLVSKHLWQDIASTHPSITTVIQLPDAPLTDPETNAPLAPDGAMSCNDAYQKLTAYFNLAVPQMVAAGAGAWGTTGTLTPFASLMQDASTWMSSGFGGAGSGGMDGAQVIQQQAAIGLLQGAFNSAASRANTGNVTTAMAITQAQESQKSTWVSAAALFSSMMGYIYALLQSFVLAIAPIVLLAMLIPGFGKKMAGNVLRLIVWLALWEPLLAIVSFLSATAGQTDIGNVFGPSGLTWSTAPVISEYANTAQVAAGFFATLMPALAWALVSGAIAFNDLINHALGSQFNAQAGGMMASGNVALNSQSMGNQAMNSHNWQEKSTFGTGETNVGLGAGAIVAGKGNGGNFQSINGQGVRNDFSLGNQTQSGVVVSDNQGVSDQQARTNQAMASAMDANMGGILMTGNHGAGTTDGHNTGTVGSDQMVVAQQIGTAAGTEFGNGVSADQGRRIEGGLQLTGRQLGAAIQQQGETPASINNAANAVSQQATAAGDAAAHQVALHGGDAAAQAKARKDATARTLGSTLSGMPRGIAGAVANAIQGSGTASLQNALKTSAGHKWATSDNNSFARSSNLTNTEGNTHAYQAARSWLQSAVTGHTGTVSNASTRAFSDQLAAQSSITSGHTTSATGTTGVGTGMQRETSNLDMRNLLGAASQAPSGIATGSGVTAPQVHAMDDKVRAGHDALKADLAAETQQRQAAAEAAAQKQIHDASVLEQQIQGGVHDVPSNGVLDKVTADNANNTATPSIARVNDGIHNTEKKADNLFSGIGSTINSANPTNLVTPTGSDGSLPMHAVEAAGATQLLGGIAPSLFDFASMGMAKSKPAVLGGAMMAEGAGVGGLVGGAITFAGVTSAGIAGYEVGTFANDHINIGGQRISDYGADFLMDHFGPKVPDFNSPTFKVTK